MADLPSAAPAATLSIHRDYLEQASPAWLTNATPARRSQLRHAPAMVPRWYRDATPAQRQKLHQTSTASFTAQTALDKAMATLQDIDTFAAALLTQALDEQFHVQLDVHKTLIVLRKPLELGLLGINVGSFEVLRVPLLQAALHNFEAGECEPDAFHALSGFFTHTPTGEHIVAVNTTLTVVQFTGLCRSLDIGAKYQRYIEGYLKPQDAVAEQALRHKFISARKADLAAAAEVALLNKDIEAADYRMIQSVINGETNPYVGDTQVWFRELGLMKKRMTGCVAFVLSDKYRYAQALILYIPHDPHHPLKRYTWPQMQAMFKQRFTARDQPDPGDGSPTHYQRFFSQFVAYGDLPAVFSALTEDSPSTAVAPGLAAYAPLLNELAKGFSPFGKFTGFKELPPEPPAEKVANPDPYLNPITLLFHGRGQWEDNLDLWDYLYTRHRDKSLADARSHAVPTADVDARVRSEKLAALLNIGLLALNAVSMFVPVLGEVMLAVMAGQLLYETFEGSLEWAEGDRRAAKAHLLDVAENLAFLAVMAGIGKGVSALVAAKPEPLIERLDPVTLPDGQARLWKPDLRGYESPASLPPDITANAQGQYLYEGKTYIRQAGRFYEKTYDPSIDRWRIQHPTDPDAYQPPLSHNGAGAWRHSLERPLAWDRLTLMRRLGPVSEGFSDEQLLTIADISGTSDATLRHMHLDSVAPPAALADTLRLFRADQDVGQVIEQVSTGQAVDGRYLYALPLLTEMPRWPTGRVLEVFDQPGLTGPTQRYGGERLYHGVRLRAPIRISRADMLSSRLPAQILAALDESEVVAMLGGEPARVRENRPQELRKQLADYARTRQPALFDSLYKGTELPAPHVSQLQRLFPGLSEHAAQSVLAKADAEQLGRLRETGRVPLAMQEQARAQLRQGRLGRAYAGLHMENLVSADSKRLALHTLARLPGWSDQLRIEVREGSTAGALLDSIGSSTAAQRKYLVKRGPQYQAFNDRGEALNSLPRAGDNFYASLMHAMPDTTRQALGLPHVGQSLALRRAIIDYAAGHRVASAQIIDQAPPRQGWFNPPQKLSPALIGYLASGRGQGISPSLASRVRDVYPQLTDDQANGFILRQMLANKSDAQIFTLLNNRLIEWQQLEATLDRWQMAEPTDAFIRQYRMMDPRPAVAQAIKACWRNAPLAELPGLDRLSLSGEVPLPALSADFSHVRSLSVSGRGMIDGHIEQVLGYFPQLQELALVGADTSLSSVPQALENMPGLTRLKITSGTDLEARELTRLEGLVGLEQLDLHSSLSSSRPLDLSRLRKLRSLRLSGSGQRVFPQGVLGLPELRRLDLRNSYIDQLPDELFASGHERMWSGLSVNWGRFTRERFKAAYDFVRSHPEHLIDQDEMVRDYCAGVLDEGLGRALSLSAPLRWPLTSLFFERWTTTQARFEAIEALSSEYEELSERLDTWFKAVNRLDESFARSQMASTLRKTWNEGLVQRYGSRQPTSLLLSRVHVSELPVLPATGFDHITDLRVQNVQVPSAQLSRFIRGFSGLHILDVSSSGLTELALAPGDWPELEHANLSHNAIEQLDVSGLARLQSLNLRGTALAAWPTGAEHLPRLTWLDLRDTRISTLPASALAQDRLLLDTHLSGTPLDAQTQADLATARQRIEQSLGMDSGALDRFDQRPAHDAFPPYESASSLARQLLSVPVSGAVEGALVRRLNSWLFTRRYSLQGDWLMTTGARRIAALRILECWRNGQRGGLAGDALELNFHGLVLGDLPQLPVSLDHIERLNLNGVGLTGPGSNAFLQAFPRLSTLVLSSNALGVLPEALSRMNQLEQLGLSATGLRDPEPLYPIWGSLARLRGLDMSYCDLSEFRLDELGHLENLNLSNNELTSWPEGALRAPLLRNLDLSSNQLESIPPGALEGGHDALMAGVDLSDNFNLPLTDFYRLQAYTERMGRDDALGMSSADVQQQINELEHPQLSSDEDEGSDVAPVLPDEVLGDAPVASANRDVWLKNLAPDEQPARTELWDQLAREPDNAAFFNLLSLLPQTREFDAARASLTGRVWRVMEAAGSNAELRQTLFGLSNTHGTCTDGRILTFSGLEIKVLEFDTLNGIDPNDLTRKGPALLRLSRNLFRLEQVEKRAAQHMRAGSDAAEVRLQYLIGLKRRLDLQGVPGTMRYAIPISGDAMEQAARDIEALERTDTFHENLISRDYWVDYLKARYPEDIIALEQRNAERRDALEDAFTSVADDGYLTGLQTLEHQLQADETQTLMALSRRADAALNPAAHDPNQPGTSSGATR